jgi:predicted Zn-dependent peptidase
VKEERRFRTDNDIQGALDESLTAAAYMAHPYHWPVVGWMADLDNITVADCHAYFKTYYAPNNATVVVVGDFKTPELMKLMERYYGAIPKQDPPRPVIDPEPPQRGERRVTLYKEAQVESVGLAFHAPRVDGEGFYAMEILQNILGSGRSSRLYKRLVYEEQAAQDVYVSNEWNRQTSLFKIYLTMKPDRKASEGETMLNEELAKVRDAEVSELELQKAKNNVRASFIRQMKTNNGKGQVAGQFEILWGDWSKHAEFLKRIDAVTRADLKKAAARFLNDINKTVITLVPKEPPSIDAESAPAANGRTNEDVARKGAQG